MALRVPPAQTLTLSGTRVYQDIGFHASAFVALHLQNNTCTPDAHQHRAQWLMLSATGLLL